MNNVPTDIDGAISITIPGDPRTKKNSMRIVRAGKYPKLLPSRAFMDYQESAGWHIGSAKGLNINYRVNLKCVYYTQTRRKVDLANLLEATCDILVHYGVLADDNCSVIQSYDGSRVEYDKDNPRVEITIRGV